MSIIEFEIEGGITGVLKALDLGAAKKHVDEGARSGAADAANENLMLRHLLELKVDGADQDLEFELARRRCPTLPNRIADILSASAGLPIRAPASKMIDVLGTDTPIGVLRSAGLGGEAAAELVAKFPDYPLRLIQVRGMDREKLFAGVIRAPDPDEISIAANANRAGRGLADAFLSLCDACIVWSREKPLRDVWEKYPAIPLHIVGYEIAELAGGSADIQFRTRR